MSTYKLQGPLVLVGDDTAALLSHGTAAADRMARVFDAHGQLVLSLGNVFQFAIWQRIKASAATTGPIQDADLDDLLRYQGISNPIATFSPDDRAAHGGNDAVIARAAVVNT